MENPEEKEKEKEKPNQKTIMGIITVVTNPRVALVCRKIVRKKEIARLV